MTIIIWAFAVYIFKKRPFFNVLDHLNKNRLKQTETQKSVVGCNFEVACFCKVNSNIKWPCFCQN